MPEAEFQISGNTLISYRGRDTRIVVPWGVENIGQECFAGQNFLAGVVIPDSVKTIQARAFEKCVHLQEVVLGANVRQIGAFAFADCAGLQSVNIPPFLEIVEDYAFSYVFGDGGKLRPKSGNPFYIELPKSIKAVGTGSFLGCDGLILYDTALMNSPGNVDCLPLPAGEKIFSSWGKALYDPDKKSGHWADSIRFKSHAILIRSSETGQISYIIWMPSRWEKREHLESIIDFWGKCGSFDFDAYDHLFSAMTCVEDKTHMAFYRLLHPFALSEKHRAAYVKFLENQSLQAVNALPKNHILDFLNLMAGNKMITGQNIEGLFDALNEAGDTKCIAWIMDYKKKNDFLNKDRLTL
jgi:hypothetical protein